MVACKSLRRSNWYPCCYCCGLMGCPVAGSIYGGYCCIIPIPPIPPPPPYKGFIMPIPPLPYKEEPPMKPPPFEPRNDIFSWKY